MIRMLQRLTGREAEPPARLPEGVRAYAIGDVHGRLDLLCDLLGRIEADDARRTAADTQVVLLGDIVDRGAQSAGLVEYLRAFRPAFARFRFVMGNHEEAMLASLDDDGGDPHLTGWLGFGGTETLLSYGMPERLLALPGPALVAALHHYVPRAHLQFLRGFEDHVAIGDYVFVHAGIRPGVPLAAQSPRDMRWIRDDFLDHRRSHGFTVVHGHTISEAPQFRANRIGIDTGAYRTGVLTALGLEADARWTIATGSPPPAA
ncbi:metallophosphoesterase family protein [Sphingomonas profundi]|uniref:metallophosphoesterase family protein n=1 Tax=Alterirhizorhabdus profundi TaxID=2681549 RepID=UPI001E2B75A4|nr:metallophosphoesterase family protein [Sphingomonas profundi]